MRSEGRPEFAFQPICRRSQPRSWPPVAFSTSATRRFEKPSISASVRLRFMRLQNDSDRERFLAFRQPCSFDKRRTAGFLKRGRGRGAARPAAGARPAARGRRQRRSRARSAGTPEGVAAAWCARTARLRHGVEKNLKAGDRPRIERFENRRMQLAKRARAHSAPAAGCRLGRDGTRPEGRRVTCTLSTGAPIAARAANASAFTS